MQTSETLLKKLLVFKTENFEPILTDRLQNQN